MALGQELGIDTKVLAGIMNTTVVVQDSREFVSQTFSWWFQLVNDPGFDSPTTNELVCCLGMRIAC